MFGALLKIIDATYRVSLRFFLRSITNSYRFLQTIFYSEKMFIFYNVRTPLANNRIVQRLKYRIVAPGSTVVGVCPFFNMHLQFVNIIVYFVFIMHDVRIKSLLVIIIRNKNILYILNVCFQVLSNSIINKINNLIIFI